MKEDERTDRTVFAFDLDGTVTREETLPILAGELGLSEEMARLTRLTMDGHFAFSESFRLRFHILKEIPLATIQGIMDTVELDPLISGFIRERAEDCAIVTGNLDLWVEPILKSWAAARLRQRAHGTRRKDWYWRLLSIKANRCGR